MKRQIQHGSQCLDGKIELSAMWLPGENSANYYLVCQVSWHPRLSYYKAGYRAGHSFTVLIHRKVHKIRWVYHLFSVKTCVLHPEWNCFPYLNSCCILLSILVSYLAIDFTGSRLTCSKAHFHYKFLLCFWIVPSSHAWALSQVFDVSIQTFFLSLWAMLQWAEDFSFAKLTPLSINLVIVVIIIFFTTGDFSSLKRNSSETIWQLLPTQLDRKERISPLYLIC